MAWGAGPLLLTVLALQACGPSQVTEAPPPEAAPAPDPEPAPAPAAPSDGKEVPRKIDLAKVKLAEKAMEFVVPAPSEVVRLIDSDDTRRRIRSLIGSEQLELDGMDKTSKAIAVGSLLADLLIVIEGAEDEEVSAKIDGVVRGLRALGANPQDVEDLEQLSHSIRSGTIARQAVVHRFDRLRLDVVDAGAAHVGPEAVALVAVGAWARAVNLIAVVALDHPEALGTMDVLKLRLVVSHLMGQLGKSDAVKPVVAILDQIVPITSDLARPTPPSVEDLNRLVSATDALLALAKAPSPPEEPTK